MIQTGGRPVLLDFGAARRVISGHAQSLTVILKPNYAPIEQYAESDSLPQGPWTDLYALGATLHFLIRGHPPTASISRAVQDSYQRLAKQSIPGFSKEFLAIVDWMLEPMPANRPQDVASLRAALIGHAADGVARQLPSDDAVTLNPRAGPLAPPRPLHEGSPASALSVARPSEEDLGSLCRWPS